MLTLSMEGTKTESPPTLLRLPEWLKLIESKLDEPKFGKRFKDEYHKLLDPNDSTITYDALVTWAAISKAIRAKFVRLDERLAKPYPEKRALGDTLDKMKHYGVRHMRWGWPSDVYRAVSAAAEKRLREEMPILLSLPEFDRLSAAILHPEDENFQISMMQDVKELYERLIPSGVIKEHDVVQYPATSEEVCSKPVSFYPAFVTAHLTWMLTMYIKLSLGLVEVLVLEGVPESKAMNIYLTLREMPDATAMLMDICYSIIAKDSTRVSIAAHISSLFDDAPIDPRIEALFNYEWRRVSPNSPSLLPKTTKYWWIDAAYYQRLVNFCTPIETILAKSYQDLVKECPLHEMASERYSPPDSRSVVFH